jgi:hypothetical protein
VAPRPKYRLLNPTAEIGADLGRRHLHVVAEKVEAKEEVEKARPLGFHRYRRQRKNPAKLQLSRWLSLGVGDSIVLPGRRLLRIWMQLLLYTVREGGPRDNPALQMAATCRFVRDALGILASPGGNLGRRQSCANQGIDCRSSGSLDGKSAADAIGVRLLGQKHRERSRDMIQRNRAGKRPGPLVYLHPQPANSLSHRLPA